MATKKRASVYMLRVTDNEWLAWPRGHWVWEGPYQSWAEESTGEATPYGTRKAADEARRRLRDESGINVDVVRFEAVPK